MIQENYPVSPARSACLKSGAIPPHLRPADSGDTFAARKSLIRPLLAVSYFLFTARVTCRRLHSASLPPAIHAFLLRKSFHSRFSRQKFFAWWREGHEKRCVDWYSYGFICAVKNGTGREDFDAAGIMMSCETVPDAYFLLRQGAGCGLSLHDQECGHGLRGHGHRAQFAGWPGGIDSRGA
jgi:hypothetical protein